MWAQLTIGAQASPERHSWAEWLGERLEAALAPLAERGVRVERQRETAGDVLLVVCRYQDGRRGRGAGGDFRALCRDRVARVLAELIVEHGETALLRQIVRRHYGYLEAELREWVVHTARGLLVAVPGGSPDASPEGRKALVYRRLREYLEQHDTVHIDGFVRFRLRDYVEQLEEAVDRAVDEYLMDREYGEFVGMLRRFLAAQDPRRELVHVLARPDGRYALRDAGGAPLAGGEGSSPHLDADGQVDGDDALIGALIGLAPLRVLLHDPEGLAPADTVETLRRVFEQRVHTCRGCDVCQPSP